MLHTVILLRHGESADRQPSQSDFNRMLTDRGRNSIEQWARQLSEERFFPEIILSSDARRAAETTQLIASMHGNNTSEILYVHALYQGSDVTYVDYISGMMNSFKCLIVVGHNPSISSTIGKLPGNYSVGLHPGQAAVIKIPLEKEKKKFWQPGVLDKLIGPF